MMQQESKIREPDPLNLIKLRLHSTNMRIEEYRMHEKVNSYVNLHYEKDSTYDDLFAEASLAEKPEKENSLQMPFRFPYYLYEDVQIRELKNKIQRVDYVTSCVVPVCSGQGFQIVPERIVTDHRKTCMIRNIPNKYTSKMLLEFINETHFGEYDFFYLRIDFKNRCNVGYAFINFLEQSSILSFYNRINGKKWPIFSSEKIAELTYASIQGIEKLKQKFKKSAVMYEEKAFRPKLFYTEGALRGTEKPAFE